MNVEEVDLKAALHPSLWRTCRALANKVRLGLLTELLTDSPQSVLQLGAKLNLSEAGASQYLRLLNARGVLAANRKGRFVQYEPKANPEVPHSQRLLDALRQALVHDGKSTDEVFKLLTAFTHPRRIDLIRSLQQGPRSFPDLIAETGIPRLALTRHLKKLSSRGFTTYDAEQKLYRSESSHDPLAAALLDMALDASW